MYKDSDVFVEIACTVCKKPMSKRIRYLRQRIRKNIYKFYCPDCLKALQSERRSGSGNPNFGGTFHGETPDMWSKEKRALADSRRQITLREKRPLAGNKNGRWAGGHMIVPCCICGGDCEVRPYIHRQILEGTRKPCCSTNCSQILARSCVPFSQTSIELKMADELKMRGLHYTEQYNLGNKFTLDFFLHEHGIVIECDGDYWHRLPKNAARDISKNAYINACGLTLFRFWECDINNDVESCVDKVVAEIDARESTS